MNSPVTLFPRTKLQLMLAVLPLTLTPAFVANAAPAKLNNGNSSVFINPASDQTVTSWLIDGQTQMVLQGFYFRVGNTGGESSLSTLNIISQSQPTANTLNVTYSNGQFSVETSYSLFGGAAGSGNANLSEQVKITNLTGSDLNFHFFQYSDFDLGGTAGGDTIQLGQNLQGLYNEALQTQGNTVISDTVITPGANHAEAGTFPGTLNSLNDGNPTTLSDTAGPLASSDATWAFQWDKVIAAGSTLIIGIDKNVYVVPIPEPSTFALLPFGFLLLAGAQRLRRRR